MPEMEDRQHKRLKYSVKRPDVAQTADPDEDVQSTEFKLAVLASLHPDQSPEIHLDYLLEYEGCTDTASRALTADFGGGVKRKRLGATGYQSSLNAFASKRTVQSTSSTAPGKLLTKKGRTLHLYSPEDVEENAPCTIIHNFLPTSQADALLKELLQEAPTFVRGTFQLFDRTVQSPHTWKFYVDSAEAVREQETQFIYDGSIYESGVIQQTTPEMLKVSGIVKEAVNKEVQRRMRDYQPEAKKLKFQSPEDWEPNSSFVNCYDGAKESVGYHSDQLTYLGPRAIVGSLSLGVAREFRVRRTVPPGEASTVAIHLPHNSLLVMHAHMQEGWKHSIAPAQTIEPHPLAGNKRFNITYRCYKDYLHPKHTPKCKCGIACVLRCVQRRKATRGRYMWMCHSNYTPGKKGCAHFAWAEFDEDGKPPWFEGYKGDATEPLPGSTTMNDDILMPC